MKTSSNKKILFTFISFIFSVLLLDIGLQIIYVILKGNPAWDLQNYFRMPDMTYIVNDGRFVSLKPNFEKVYNEKWTLITDSHGFRLGKNKISEKNNILFIGDSVPFGWGVNVEETIPEKLNDLLIMNNIDVGIINAAIPSYSLDQSVHRYIEEIKDKFPKFFLLSKIFLFLKV